MSESACARESAVQRAARTGFWPEDLKLHAAECAACNEVALIAAFLQGADAPRGFEDPDDPLPDPRALWLKARLGGSPEARSALRSIEITEKIAWTTAGVLVIAGAVVWGPQALGVVAEMKEGARLLTTVPVSGLLSTPVLLAGGVALILTSALFTLFLDWAAE